jgi:DNA-binding transcriptional ArsR family regulator
MVWRIHFTAEDLERIQVSPTLGPLAETVMALSLLRCPWRSPTSFSEWRGQVSGKVTAQMKALTYMIPPGTTGVDLCTLTGEAPTIEQGVQALLAVPSENLLTEMEITDRWHKLPAAAWAAAEADGEARRELAAATQAAYQALVEPYWIRIHARLQADQVARSRTLAYGGPDRLLASLQSQWIRWRPPVLEVLMTSRLEMHLNGRGLALVPSVFVGQRPLLTWDPRDEIATPRLILPAADSPNGHGYLWDGRRSDGAALAALVGRNRAAVLRAVADGCTTTELAYRVGISQAAASQHTSVLREAGLISTCRQGSAVLHVITPLGAELLQAG